MIKRWTRSGVTEFLLEQLASLPVGASVLVIGGKGPVLDVITRLTSRNLKIITLDINHKHVPDYVADVSDKTFFSKFQDNFDAVVLIEVLEHVPNYVDALENVYSVLKPGGKIIASTPWIIPLHDAPHDYHRFTLYEISRMLFNANFENSLIESRGNFFDSKVCLSLRGFFFRKWIYRLSALVILSISIFLPRPKRYTEAQESQIGFNFTGVRSA